MVMKVIIVAILLCSMIIPFGGFLLSKKKKGGLKAALASNIFFFFGTVVVADILLFKGDVHAAGEVAQTAASGEGWRYMAAALSTGLSCIGIMGKALIFVALAESIALYGLLISFSILG